MKQKPLTWVKDANFFYCSICDGPEPPETHVSLPFGMLTLPSEPAMNAAGRTSDHPFKDIRAADRAHRRTKRYPKRLHSSNKRRRRDSCLMSPTNAQHKKADAYERIQRREWEDDWEAERRHKMDLEHMDDIVEHERFGKHADIFERNNDPVVSSSEDFGTWVRRRISEMRWVKESRIQRTGKPACGPEAMLVLPHTMYAARPGGVKATIPTAPFAHSKDTTLPTNIDDIQAHLLLACVLKPSKHFLQHCRHKRKPPFQAIGGFRWWGEYTWAWHRNMSGCWVLGYGKCDGYTVPCTCCCTGNGSMYYSCYCEDFSVGTMLEEPAPEDQHRCSLVEWVNDKLRNRMEEDEKVFQEQLARGLGKDADEQKRIEEHQISWEANFWGVEWECKWGHLWEEEYVVVDDARSEEWIVVQDGMEPEVPVA